MAMLDREISAQPQVLSSLLQREKKQVERFAKYIKKAGLTNVFIVARGSSDNAGVFAKYLFGARNHMVTALAAPSLFTLYDSGPKLRKHLVLAISQSGESEDLCQVVANASKQGAYTLVVTNRPNSPLASEAKDVLALHAGMERSVAATKSYTSELMAMAMLSVALDGSAKDWSALASLSGMVARTLDMHAGLDMAAQRYRYAQRLAVIGRGFNYCTAFELSLKLKELAYLVAEPYSSADFRHGPIAVVADGFPVLIVMPSGKTFADTKALVKTLRERKAELIIISDNKQILKSAKVGLPIPRGVPEWLSPVVSVVPGQLFARHLAKARDCPLDKPRGLSKVTTTR